MTIELVRGRFLFREVNERGFDLPLGSVTRDGGVEFRSDLDISVWNPGDDTSGYKRVIPGDFVIGLRSFQSGIGHSSIETIVSPAYTVLRPVSERVHGGYFKHLFKSDLYVSRLENVAQGIRQGRTIATEDFYNIECPVPPLAEQQAIADYLDTETARIDALIAKRQKLMGLLEERLMAGVRSLVTGLAEPGPRWTPGPRWAGSVPSSWSPMKIAWHKCTGSGTTPETDLEANYEGGVIPWVTTAELRERRIDSTAKSVTAGALARYSALKEFPVGTVLIAMYGATVGRLGVLDVPATTNQACCAVFGPGALEQEFLFWWLRVFRSDLLDLAYGAGQPNISQETIRSLRVPAPPSDLQLHVARSCEELSRNCDSAVRALARQIDLLSEHRQALVTLAVMGKLSVPGAA